MGEAGEAATQRSAEAAPSAGALLRQARQAQGLHIVALAASIKVPPRKLEALEADRFDQLPDATFARALAQTVCKVLKIDAEPVLARLPQPAGARLEHVALGLNAPYQERAAHRDSEKWALLKRPALWGTLLVLLGAAALWWWPARWWQAGAEPGQAAPPAAAASAASAVAAPVAAPPVVVETVHSTPPESAASTPAEPAVVASVANASPMLLLRTSGESWVEVLDAKGQRLLARHLQAGESVGLDGGAPLRVTVGNVAATQLSYRGRSIDLAATTRDNVARIELK